MQVLDVMANGYWHARSPAYTATPLARTLEWLRMPGDLVFMFLGALPLSLAMVWGYFSGWRRVGDTTVHEKTADGSFGLPAPSVS